MIDSKDMTIRDVRVTVLRMPWANPEWIKGHALGPDRGILIVDVETAGGITGMGYLFHFRPGLRSIATFLEECVIPRVKGKDATVITDPCPPSTGFVAGKHDVELLTISHAHPDHSYTRSISAGMTLTRPGEYEFSDLLITGIRTYHDGEAGGSRG